MGQGGGSGGDSQGYEITFQNALDSRIFIALDKEPVYLSYRYASIDGDGMSDGFAVQL